MITSPFWKDKDFIKRKLRKKSKSVFSIITGRFGNVIKVTSIDGFLTKLKLFITAYSMDFAFKVVWWAYAQLAIWVYNVLYWWIPIAKKDF